MRRKKNYFQVSHSSVSLPVKILKEVDRLIEERDYWPSRSAFVREACLEKVRHEREEIRSDHRR